MADVSTEVGGSEFDTGSTVLVKVKGYPAWPAVIVGEEDLAPEILDAKPKSKEVYPVLFYVDNNYSWVTDTEIKELTRERAAQLASGSKKKKALVEAFKIAADPPNYKDYIDLVNNPPEIIEEPVAELEAEAEPEVVPHQIKKARKAVEKPVKATSRSRGNRKRKAADGDLDADGTLDDLDIEELDHRIELKARKRGRPSNDKDKNTARDEDFARSSHLRLELCKELRVRLQKGLLDAPPTPAMMKKLSSYLKQLEAVPSLEIAFVRQSKINRVLKVAVKLDLPLDSDLKFTSRCLALLEEWNTPAEPVMHGLPPASYQALQEENARNGIKNEEDGTEELESEMSVEPSAEPHGSELREDTADIKQETPVPTDPEAMHQDEAESARTEPEPEAAVPKPEAAVSEPEAAAPEPDAVPEPEVSVPEPAASEPAVPADRVPAGAAEPVPAQAPQATATPEANSVEAAGTESTDVKS